VTELELRESQVGEARVVAVEGELDLASAPRLSEALGRLSEAPEAPLVVDLSRCAFIDSTGIAAIVHASAPFRERGVEFSVVCGEGTPRDVLRLTAIDQALPVYTSVDEALSRASG
jgi:anti-sigma B factor antagonist